MIACYDILVLTLVTGGPPLYLPLNNKVFHPTTLRISVCSVSDFLDNGAIWTLIIVKL